MCVRFHAHVQQAAAAGQVQLMPGTRLTARSLLQHAGKGALHYMAAHHSSSPPQAVLAAVLRCYLPGVSDTRQRQLLVQTAADLLAPLQQRTVFNTPPMPSSSGDPWEQQAGQLGTLVAGDWCCSTERQTCSQHVAHCIAWTVVLAVCCADETMLCAHAQAKGGAGSAACACATCTSHH